ncbi:MAG: rhodanese-like domain-containing protein [Alphaproteobacteria bacterium]|nr:rhodanese-like domain-containing protein [Alphaproteobacteria bacterium]
MFPAEISPAEIKKNNLILDVRTPAEHEELALIQEHWFVPLDQLEPTSFIREHHLDGSKPLYILCRSGKRAEIAAQKFKQAGLKKVAVIRGGIIAAEKMGLPIKK